MEQTRTMSQQELIDARTSVAWDNDPGGRVLVAVIRSVPGWMTLTLEEAAEQGVLNVLHVGRVVPLGGSRWAAWWVIDRTSGIYMMRCADIYEAKAAVEAGVAWVRALLLAESFYQRVEIT